MAKPASKAPAKVHPHAALAAHADDRDTIEFNEKVLHGRLAFNKGEVVKFLDPRVAAYFDVAFNATEFTTKKPTRTIGDDEINFDADDERENETIDPHTLIGRGRNGIEPGTSVHQHLTGETGSGDAPLQPHESNLGAEG